MTLVVVSMTALFAACTSCNVHDALPVQKRHTLEFLRGIAHLRPRTNTISAVARVRSALSAATHRYVWIAAAATALLTNTATATSARCQGGDMQQLTKHLEMLSTEFSATMGMPSLVNRFSRLYMATSSQHYLHHALYTCAASVGCQHWVNVPLVVIYCHCSFFQGAGFQYVHTPIISASDCEGAGEMFQVRQ